MARFLLILLWTVDLREPTAQKTALGTGALTMENYPPRYAMQQDRDRSWSVMDTAIDVTRKESRVIMGLSRKQVKVIIKALNKPAERSLDEASSDHLGGSPLRN